MHAQQFDLGEARQGFLASLTNFWPHQLRPVQGNNCRPNVSAIPRQALLVLTSASRGLFQPWRPFMFFAFPSQFWPQPTVARPGQAGLTLWPRLPCFFFPWPAWPKSGLWLGSPWLSGRALTPVYPGLAGLLMQGFDCFECSIITRKVVSILPHCVLTSFLKHCQTLTKLKEGWLTILNPLNNGPNALCNSPK